MTFNRHKNRRRTAKLFDDTKPLTPTRRNLNTAGTVFHPGQPIDKKKTDLSFRCRMWVSGRAVYLEEFTPVKVSAAVVTPPAEDADSADKVDTPAENADLLADQVDETGSGVDAEAPSGAETPADAGKESQDPASKKTKASKGKKG